MSSTNQTGRQKVNPLKRLVGIVRRILGIRTNDDAPPHPDQTQNQRTDTDTVCAFTGKEKIRKKTGEVAKRMNSIGDL